MLAAAAALPLIAATGCRGVGALAPPPSPAADVGLLKAAIARERLMIARYAAVLGSAHTASAATSQGIQRPAELTASLEPLLAEHQAHLAQLQSRLIVPAGATAALSAGRQSPHSPQNSPSASVSPATPGGSSAQRGPAVPTEPAAALAFLRAAEQHASDALLSQLGTAPASLAQLLASISASEATHAAFLKSPGKAG
jgi:hypothetical protein